MLIATWNINGVRARLDNLLTWLRQTGPDIVGLQEIKCVDEAFPAAAIEELGYNVATHGQKGFNGVALLSRLPPDEVTRGLPGDAGDVQARFIEGVFSVPSGVVRVACGYMPNGNPVDSDKFAYKLAWMERLEAWTSKRLAFEEPLVVMGDYNVIPTPRDVRRPDAWRGDALFRPESRLAFTRLGGLGLGDAVRMTDDGDRVYTFWDYQAGAYARDDGIRIDHLMLSPEAADRLEAAGVDRVPRGWEKPSDHVPAWIRLAV